MTYIIYYIILYYQIKPIAVFCLFTNYCSRPGRQGLSEYHAAPSFFGRKEDLNYPHNDMPVAKYCRAIVCKKRLARARRCDVEKQRKKFKKLQRSLNFQIVHIILFLNCNFITTTCSLFFFTSVNKSRNR
jgi:uncharacterized paraquat-inducible protein A